MFSPSSRFYSCRCCSGDVNGDANVDGDGAASVCRRQRRIACLLLLLLFKF